MLPSLSFRTSLQTYPVTPWEFVPATPIPDSVRTSKSDREAWITNPTTRHNIFFGWEGLNAGARISAGGASEDDENPPYKLIALCADFDAPWTPGIIAQNLSRLHFQPNYLGKSLSGNLHVVWLLEQPIIVPSRAFAVHFLEHVLRQSNLRDLHVCFDAGFFTSPERGLTNGCDWTAHAPDARIPVAVTRGWFFEAGEKFLWTQNRGHGIAIPLIDVATELEKRYPNFRTAWEGDFGLGAQGPSFWVTGSTSLKSAIVRETGMQTFAAHASKSFYPWSDLLGLQWVASYETRKIGDAVKDIFHDGKSYWRRLPDGQWRPFGKEDITEHLEVTCGLKGRGKAGRGESARATQHIQDYNAIEGAGPFVFKPSGAIDVKGTKILNTHTRLVLQPAPGNPVWGSEGSFPWLSHFFDGFFSTDEQRINFLAWLQRFYSSAHELNLESGQNIFIFGGPGRGKTFLSTQILGRLLGGAVDARRYLMGEDSFGSSLFESAVWAIDDNEMSTDAKVHRRFTEMVKKMAANTTFEYHQKFRVPVTVEWHGRVVVTANTDAESQRVLPDLERAILDKMNIYLANDGADPGFKSNRENHEMLDRELPFFARWLLNWVPPEDVMSGSPRYGVVCYHAPEIVTSAKYSSHSAGFREILDEFCDIHFKDKSIAKWEGSAVGLRNAIVAVGMESVLRSYGQEDFVRRLTQLADTGAYPVSYRNNSQRRTWTLRRPDQRPDTIPDTPAGLPQLQDSKFSKASQ